MTGKTHRVGGAIAGALVIHISGYNLDVAACTMVGAIFGSLLPDIDHPKSTISIKLWFVSWPLMILKQIIKMATSGLSKKKQRNISSMLGHRGITHSLLACISVLVAAIAIGAFIQVKGNGNGSTEGYYIAFAIGILAGMVSHLALDMLSNGVPLLCPISYKRVGVKWIKTGSIQEWILFTILCVLLSLVAVKEGVQLTGLSGK